MKISKLLWSKTATKAVFFVLIGILVVAGVIEKYQGTPYVYEHIYGSTWFVFLWGVLTFFALVWIFVSRLYKRLPTFCLHLSFLVILLGALITHFTGQQGKMFIQKGCPEDVFVTSQGDSLRLPFTLTLKDFSIDYYPGSNAAMDYESKFKVGGVHVDSIEGKVSMNHIFTFCHYRFYQAGYNDEGSFLSVSRDPWGITITYIGYALLLLTMLLFCFDKQSMFRRLLRQPLLRHSSYVIICLIALSSCNGQESKTKPQALPDSIASRYASLYIYYNNRVCPLQTPARLLLTKVHGSTTYKSLSAEQVLTGWLYFFNSWKDEPIILVKSRRVRQALSIKGKYASLSDFTNRDNVRRMSSLVDSAHRGLLGKESKGVLETDEKFQILTMMATGSLLKIYPYKQGDRVVWFAPTDRYPHDLSPEKRIFMRKMLHYIGESIMLKDYGQTRILLSKLKSYQQQEIAGQLISDKKMRAEMIYNAFPSSRSIAVFSLIIGMLGLCVSLIWRKKKHTSFRYILWGVVIILWLLLTSTLILRGYVSGHLPMSNGYETMQCMAWIILTGVCLFSRSLPLLLPAGIFLSGLAMMVSMMGETNPAVTPLMPVLSSPLLSIHVAAVMLSYVLFSFMMLCGVIGLYFEFVRHDAEESLRMMLWSRLLLYIALFFIIIGIFIGAIWANVSWGRYWGWDPKETWALITMLIYSIALHLRSFPRLNNTVTYHLFIIMAYFSVIITYFGVNFFLGGLHSYA